MTQTESIPGKVNEREARAQLKQQLAQYIQQQPASMQALHKWMQGLEAASIVLIAGVFILALYISIAWKSFDSKYISTAWFLFAASAAPRLLFSGIHSLILHVFPTGLMHGNAQKLVTGSAALWIGWAYILGSLILAAFWGLFAYASWTLNWAILSPLISIAGVVLGVFIVIAMFLAVIQQLTKFR